MNERVWDFMTQKELEQTAGAIALVVEVNTPNGNVQIIGPYPLDTADAFAAVELLRSEENPEDEPNVYSVFYLYPVEHAMKPRRSAH